MEQAATILALFITFNPLTCDKNRRKKNIKSISSKLIKNNRQFKYLEIAIHQYSMNS